MSLLQRTLRNNNVFIIYWYRSPTLSSRLCNMVATLYKGNNTRWGFQLVLKVHYVQTQPHVQFTARLSVSLRRRVEPSKWTGISCRAIRVEGHAQCEKTISVPAISNQTGRERKGHPCTILGAVVRIGLVYNFRREDFTLCILLPRWYKWETCPSLSLPLSH